jgi:hypothetical protein
VESPAALVKTHEQSAKTIRGGGYRSDLNAVPRAANRAGILLRAGWTRSRLSADMQKQPDAAGEALTASVYVGIIQP